MPERLEMPMQWSGVPRHQNVPLRERLLDAIADAMLRIDDAVDMIESEPEGREFHFAGDELRNCYQCFNELMRRMAD
jgi:hypothetical protein